VALSTIAPGARVKIWDVTVVGEIYIDHVMSGFETWPKPGEEVASDHYTREIGGGCATTACGLSRLGKSVNLVGVIGNEDAPWLERRLADFGVTDQGLRRVSGPTGVTLSVSTSSLDVGYQPAWLTDETNYATCQTVDYLLPNEQEAALLSGGETPADFFAFARKLRMRSGILKLGARGTMSDVDGVTITVSPPKVVAIDSTGSGDAFDAGFIDALLEGANEEERLRRACICGALSTRVPGALGGLPNREELWSIYEKTYGS
jgi:sugar/nucleoside kinase (ribokinase family)